MEQIPDRGSVILTQIKLTVDGLIQMTGITFVGKSGIQSKMVSGIFTVDVDNIILHVIDRRCQIIGRTAIISHGRRDRFDGHGGHKIIFDCRKSREIITHPCLQILQNGGRIVNRKIQG